MTAELLWRAVCLYCGPQEVCSDGDRKRERGRKGKWEKERTEKGEKRSKVHTHTTFL